MNYIVRTVDGLEHTLEEVAPLELNGQGTEYLFRDEKDTTRIPFRCPVKSVTAIIDRSQYKGAPDAAILEKTINHSTVPQSVRDKVLMEARQESNRWLVRPLENAQERKLQIFDTAEIEAGPVEIECPKLPPWPLKTHPKQYLKKYPGGRHALLARAVLVPLRTLVETIVHMANETYQRKVAEEDPNEPVLTITVRDLGDEPFMTVPVSVWKEMVGAGEFAPILSPVWERPNKKQVRVEETPDKKMVLRSCRMEMAGRVRIQRASLEVPREAVQQ